MLSKMKNAQVFHTFRLVDELNLLGSYANNFEFAVIPYPSPKFQDFPSLENVLLKITTFFKFSLFWEP